MKSKLKFMMAFAFIFLASALYAQVPQLFNYQGVARDAKGNPMSNQQISLKLTILPTADASAAEYEETQIVKTNEFGLYTLQIGNGHALTGEMKTVKWETGNKYIQVAIDPKGGSDYVVAGTSQLLSVPYALYADKAGSSHDKTRTGAVSSAAGHVSGDVNYLTKFTALNTIGKSLLYDNGSNVGVGTTSPVARLHMYYSTSGILEHIRMHNPNSNGAGRFTMYNDGDNSYATFTKYGSTRTGAYNAFYPYANLLAFGNNGLTAGDGLGRFLISTAGNVGISIFKSGSTKMKFHADFDTENVGIGGNSAPASRVHLNNTDGTLMDLRLTNNTSGHTATDGLVISQSGNVSTIMNRENSSLMLGTNNNNQITITNGGAVGVGTTTPTTKLDVNGQIRMQGGAPGAGKLMTSDANGVGSWSTAAGAGLVSGSGTSNYIPKFTPDGNTLGNSLITDDGAHVGIGTVGSYKLDVLHGGGDGIRIKSSAGFSTVDIDAANSDAAIRFANNGVNKWGFRINNPDFQLFEFGNGTVLNVKSGTKNIGIGTNTPKNKLDVYGGLAIGTGNAGTNTAPANGAIIEGKVGIGNTTPISRLSIQGNDNSLLNIFNPVEDAEFDPTDPNLDDNVGLSFHSAKVVGKGLLSSIIANGGTGGSYSGRLLFWTSPGASDPVERMRIEHNGNVGIGTSEPTEKLEVSGKVKIVDGSQGNQKVLTSNANGVGTWTNTNTLPGTISDMKYVNTSTLTPSNTLSFLNNSRVAVTITSTSQTVLITGTVALGSTIVGGANGLNLYVGYNTTDLVTPVSTIGAGVWGITTVQNTRNIYTVTATVTGLTPGTYYFGVAGLCTTTPANWNNNEWGYVSVLVKN